MAPETETIVAESSPSEILAKMTPKEKATWRQTGALPETPAKEAPKEKPEAKTEAESSTAAKTEVTESKSEETKTESSAAPVTAEKEHKPNKGAEARIKELLSENKRLAAELDTARKIPVIAPAKIEEVARPRRNDVDAKTGHPMFASDEAYEEAVEKYLTTKVTADVEKRQATAQREAAIKAQNEIIQRRWQNSLAIAIERNGDWAKVVGLDDKTGKYQNADLKTIKEHGVLDAWILDSEIGADMLYFFAKTPAEIARIQSLSPFAAARELTKLEDKLSGQVSAPAKETKQETKEEKAERSDPSVTKAPAPATSVGGKSTAPVDELDSKVKTGDFKAYREVANREDALKRKAS